MPKERLVGGGVLLLGLLSFFVLIPAGVDTPASIGHLSLSPDFWPRIISGVFALMGLLMLINPDKASGEAAEEDSAATAWKERFPRLAVVLAALFCFYYIIPHLGMVAPGAVFIFALMWFAGERRYPLMAVISTTTPLLLYFFFAYVANIPIPLGIFESLRG